MQRMTSEHFPDFSLEIWENDERVQSEHPIMELVDFIKNAMETMVYNEENFEVVNSIYEAKLQKYLDAAGVQYQKTENVFLLK